MSEKRNRQQVLLKLLGEKKVSNQEQLQQLLHSEGIYVTQATLSRDLKELDVVKMHVPDKVYCYVAGHGHFGMRLDKEFPALDVLSVALSGQLVIMKTRPGYASVVASAIDNSPAKGVLGTVAGDDTLFVALEEGVDKLVLLDELERVVPRIRKRLIS